MRLIRSVLWIFILMISVEAKEKSVNINFKDLSIMNLIDITSKIMNKNILITSNIGGNVDFKSNKLLYKDDILNILVYVLQSKGYVLIESENILRIVKLTEASKYNAPIVKDSEKKNYFQMITEIFHIDNFNSDFIASKIKHLLSKNAKLVTNNKSNLVIITDFKNNIKTIKKVINLITKTEEKTIEVVVLKNIEAASAKATLETIAKSIFNVKVIDDQVIILVNKENNAVSIVGSNKNVQYLKKYILSIDKNGTKVRRVVEVIQLKNAESENVIKIINSIIGKKKYLDPNSKPYASSDKESNTLVFMGPKDEISYLKEITNKLDKDQLQVYVKARIIEVDDSLVNNVGVKYGIFGGSTSKHGLLTFASNLNGGDALAFLPESIGLSIPNLSSGLALGASISLLQQNFALDVLSEPSILSINNKESSLYVGETISIQTGSTTNDTGTSSSFKREDVGLTLKIKPRISNGNKVTLEIETTIEGVKETKSDSVNPDTSKKSIITTAIVNNGESVIIGGLIEQKSESTVNKVPILGDIPLFGELFRHRGTVTGQKNLVIIITPYIVPSAKDLTFVREKLSELSLLEDEFLAKTLIRLRNKQIKNKNIEKEKKSDVKFD